MVNPRLKKEIEAEEGREEFIPILLCNVMIEDHRDSGQNIQILWLR